MQPFIKVDHIQLAIPPGGEHRARAFYVELLGLEETPKPPELSSRGGVWLRSGEVRIHLGVDPDFRPATKAHPAFRVSNYRALLQKFEHSALALTRDALFFDGSEHCYVFDPFGNRIELIEGK